VKVVHKSFLLSNEGMTIEDIKNEVKILKELKSDFILRYLEEYENEDYYFIFTEKCVIILFVSLNKLT